jgi:hypothetical protein
MAGIISGRGNWSDRPFITQKLPKPDTVNKGIYMFMEIAA